MSRAVRPIRFLTGVAVIELTNGQYAIIDVDDVHKVDDRNWHADWRRSAYYVCGYSTRVNGEPNKRIHLHSVILSVPDGMQVDHINGNTLDNRKSNLRAATNGENQQNGRKYKNNTSGFKGVTYYKWTRKFLAQIGAAGKRKHLGYFHTPEEAARAYDVAARIHHGEFARLNFTDDSSPPVRSSNLPDAR